LNSIRILGIFTFGLFGYEVGSPWGLKVFKGIVKTFGGPQGFKGGIGAKGRV